MKVIVYFSDNRYGINALHTCNLNLENTLPERSACAIIVNRAEVRVAATMFEIRTPEELSGSSSRYFSL